jgi:hypothetical protein
MTCTSKSGNLLCLRTAQRLRLSFYEEGALKLKLDITACLNQKTSSENNRSSKKTAQLFERASELRNESEKKYIQYDQFFRSFKQYKLINSRIWTKFVLQMHRPFIADLKNPNPECLSEEGIIFRVTKSLDDHQNYTNWFLCRVSGEESFLSILGTKRGRL